MFWRSIIAMAAATMSAHAQVSEQDSLLVASADFGLPPDSVLIVDDVVVAGNVRTKSYVVLREMTLKQGDYVTVNALEHDKKRIYSLGLFTRVEIGYVPTQEPKARLVVLVNERWYIYPFPLVGIKDRDWKKFYIGGGITHQNFRGRNEKLYAALTVGYDPTVIFSYRNPLIDAEHNYFMNVGLAWSVVRNRSILAAAGGDNFDERHFRVSLDFGRRIGLAHNVWVAGGYEIVRVTGYRPGRTLSDDGSDQFPLAAVGYLYNTRDLDEYAMYGSFARATVTKYGFPGGTVDFVRYAFDYRRFVPLNPSLTLAGRLFGDFSAGGGQVPTYSRVFLGYSERIRGHFSQVIEGEQQLGASLELRWMLVQPRYITVDFVPVPEFAVWKFGVAAAAFADVGSVWFRNEPLAIDRSIRGYGFGLHFLLPYGFVVRTELGFNEARDAEFIVDLSAAL